MDGRALKTISGNDQFSVQFLLDQSLVLPWLKMWVHVIPTRRVYWSHAWISHWGQINVPISQHMFSTMYWTVINQWPSVRDLVLVHGLYVKWPWNSMVNISKFLKKRECVCVCVCVFPSLWKCIIWRLEINIMKKLGSFRKEDHRYMIPI